MRTRAAISSTPSRFLLVEEASPAGVSVATPERPVPRSRRLPRGLRAAERRSAPRPGRLRVARHQRRGPRRGASRRLRCSAPTVTCIGAFARRWRASSRRARSTPHVRTPDWSPTSSSGRSRRGSCDLVSEFARPYVQRTTGHFVGLASDEIDDYWRGVEALATATCRDDYERGGLLLADYAEHALEQARSQPGEGVLGVLARDVESGALSERHAVALIATLVSAGHEPAINQVAMMASLLSRHPDVWEATATETSTLRASWRRCCVSVRRTRASSGRSPNPWRWTASPSRSASP